MKENKNTTQPFSLQKGFFSQEIYDDYHSMKESASDNWGFKCTYQLLPHGLNGEHKVLQLDTMQLSYAKRPGGMMHDTSAAYPSGFSRYTFLLQYYHLGESNYIQTHNICESFPLTIGHYAIWNLPNPSFESSHINNEIVSL